MRLQIFLLSSFQLICAALLLGTNSVSMSFQSLSEQLDRISLESFSEQLCKNSQELQNTASEQASSAVDSEELSAYKRSFACSNFGCIQLGCLPAQELSASNAAT